MLVVEDHDELRRLLAEFLTRRGCVVEEASDGVEALTALDRRPFDVVISDLAMPRLDGAGLWLRARADRRRQGTRWIIVSSGPPPRVITEAGLTFLAKPYELEEVWTAVRTAVAHQD